MSKLSVALGNSGGKHTITVNGTVYSCGLITNATNVQLEKTWFRQAKDTIVELRHDIDKADYMAMLKDVTDAYNRGEYSLKGKRGQEAIATDKGMFTLLGILFDLGEHDLMQLMAVAANEMKVVLDAVLHESFDQVDFSQLEDGEKKA